jgi:hypothetical protein
MDTTHENLINRVYAPHVRLLATTGVPGEAFAQVLVGGRSILVHGDLEVKCSSICSKPPQRRLGAVDIETGIEKRVLDGKTYWSLRTSSDHGRRRATCLAGDLTEMETVIFLLGVAAGTAVATAGGEQAHAS